MGADKATLVVGGVALARRVADVLVAAGADDVRAIGGDRVALVGLGLDVVDDAHPGEGPLGGIVTALDAADHDVVVVLACDLPAVTPDAVRDLVEALDRTGCDAAVVRADGVAQGVVAAYRRRARPALAGAFEAGERSVRRVLDRLDVTWIDDVDPTQLADLDGPDDLRRYAARRPPTTNGSTGGRT
jgi:molybdopterin-guanine dinucleotide biosynthesis protein A